MHVTSFSRNVVAAVALLAASASIGLMAPVGAQAPSLREDASARQAAGRPMTFLDMQQMKQIGGTTPSPDGKWLLYTLSTPDWKEAKSQTDVYLVSVQQGVSSTRQMTFTKEKNETSPRWAHDGSFFLFLSNREAPESASSRNQ